MVLISSASPMMKVSYVLSHVGYHMRMTVALQHQQTRFTALNVRAWSVLFLFYFFLLSTKAGYTGPVHCRQI